MKSFTGTLAGFLANTELNKLIEAQTQADALSKKILDMRSTTSVYNKEFDERHNVMTPYKMSAFGTNQDIILLGFYFSYAFLTIVSLIVFYKNTQKIETVMYALLMSIVFLLIITSMLLRVA